MRQYLDEPETQRKRDYACAEKAKANNELTFTLRAQDETAPETIAEWIKLNIRTAPREKLVDALLTACNMREHEPRKMPD